MNVLPEGSQLGQLSLIDVLDYFDGPRLFTARSGTGQLFLAAWVESVGAGDRWLYVPISPARLRALWTGDTGTTEAFSNPEAGYAAIVLTGMYGEPDEVRWVRSDSIEEDSLPRLASPDLSRRVAYQTR